MPFDRTLLLATSNLNKLREARAILSEFKIRVRRLQSPKIEIQNRSLEKIASFAADELSGRYSGTIAVEDSGLFLNSLKGFPGPFSAYSFRTIGPPGILRLLGTSTQRRARFETAVAVSRSGHSLMTFTGRIRGTIAHSQRGTKGFGFDPIFIPDGDRRTFGEMTVSEKNSRSHRGKAFRQLAKWIASSTSHQHLLQTAES